ncbi:MAG: hypothetical protein MJ166_10805 [Clostridia bacterium]|nr:hypothetical protein [Clostridia bacterium]
MARGGHHGGSFHSGGHHGGGFRGGGSFHGGGGRSYHRSSGTHYHGSSSYDDDEDDDIVGRLLPLAFVCLIVIVRAFAFIGELGCFDIWNTIMIIAALIIFFVVAKSNGKYSAVNNLRYKELPTFCDTIYKHPNTFFNKINEVADGSSWYDDHYFHIEFYSRHFKEDNIKNVSAEIRKWPIVLKIKQSFWPIFAMIWFCVNFFFYEATIGTFEHRIMSDAAFNFIDNLLYYLPAIMILLSSIAMLVIQIIRGRLLRQICIKIVDENRTKKIVEDTNEEIYGIQKSTWYHNECPNCSALASEKDTRCHSCGTSLKILNYDQVSALNRHQVLPSQPKPKKPTSVAPKASDEDKK